VENIEKIDEGNYEEALTDSFLKEMGKKLSASILIDLRIETPGFSIEKGIQPRPEQHLFDDHGNPISGPNVPYPRKLSVTFRRGLVHTHGIDGEHIYETNAQDFSPMEKLRDISHDQREKKRNKRGNPFITI